MFDFKLLISAIVFVFIDSAYLNLIKSYFSNKIKYVQGSPMKINFLVMYFLYLV